MDPSLAVIVLACLQSFEFEEDPVKAAHRQHIQQASLTRRNSSRSANSHQDQQQSHKLLSPDVHQQCKHAENGTGGECKADMARLPAHILKAADPPASAFWSKHEHLNNRYVVKPHSVLLLVHRVQLTVTPYTIWTSSSPPRILLQHCNTSKQGTSIVLLQSHHMQSHWVAAVGCWVMTQLRCCSGTTGERCCCCSGLRHGEE